MIITVKKLAFIALFLLGGCVAFQPQIGMDYPAFKHMVGKSFNGAPELVSADGDVAVYKAPSRDPYVYYHFQNDKLVKVEDRREAANRQIAENLSNLTVDQKLKLMEIMQQQAGQAQLSNQFAIQQGMQMSQQIQQQQQQQRQLQQQQEQQFQQRQQAIQQRQQWLQQEQNRKCTRDIYGNQMC